MVRGIVGGWGVVWFGILVFLLVFGFFVVSRVVVVFKWNLFFVIVFEWFCERVLRGFLRILRFGLG